MSGTRMKVLTSRKYVTRGETRTAWLEIGVAWVNDKGADIQLHALPLPDENGQVRFVIRPLDSDNQQTQPQQQRRPQPQVEYATTRQGAGHTQREPSGYGPNAGDDDQIPF